MMKKQTSTGHQTMHVVFVATVLFLLLLTGTNCPAQKAVSSPAPANAQEVKNPFAGNSDAVSEGASIFKSKCAECHGDGTGGTGPDLTDDSWIYGGTDAKVFETVSFGRAGGMPQWRTELSKDEIWKVITYVRSLQKK